jgi:hypothetical protein
MAYSSRNDGILAVAIAVSRSGKSVWLKRAIEGDKRVLAFDPKGEYVTQLGFVACRTRKELIDALRKSTGEARIAYVQNDKKEFNFFCDCAFNWNRQAPATIVCEELGNTTNCGKASGHWGRLISQGLAYGPKVIGTVQRGQEVDKSILNNATFVHVMRHSTEHDREYIAGQLGLQVSDIPGKKLEFLQWTSDKGLVCSGTVDFPPSKKTKNWPSGAPRFRSRGDKRRVLTVGTDAKFKQVQYST